MKFNYEKLRQLMLTTNEEVKTNLNAYKQKRDTSISIFYFEKLKIISFFGSIASFYIAYSKRFTRRYIYSFVFAGNIFTFLLSNYYHKKLVSKMKDMIVLSDDDTVNDYIEFYKIYYPLDYTKSINMEEYTNKK